MANKCIVSLHNFVQSMAIISQSKLDSSSGFNMNQHTESFVALSHLQKHTEVLQLYTHSSTSICTHPTVPALHKPTLHFGNPTRVGNTTTQRLCQADKTDLDCIKKKIHI